MDYYYGEVLRWTFGFENPNKAAVIFACLLPLAGMVHALSWRLSWRRIPAVFLSASAVAAVGFLLVKTYSRGGVVAGLAGLAYVIFREWRFLTPPGRRAGWGRILCLGGLMTVMVLEFGLTGFVGRTAKPFTEGDASVENRFELWKAGLQMAVENPSGFGSGNSGQAYMNWYQPLDSTAGYRTMVNSYLTALVEWGWMAFLPAVCLAAFLWGWANPGKPGSCGHGVASGFRGAILAFAVAGIFSTTMEEEKLWILPAGFLLFLGVWALIERRPLRSGITALLGAAAICAAGYACGWALAVRDPLRRQFHSEKSLVIGPKNGEATSWSVASDSVVLGDRPGKLLRQLSREASMQLRIDFEKLDGMTPRLILAGESVSKTLPDELESLVLLAPAKVPAERARSILASGKNVKVYLPEIDEDGRSTMWEQVVEESGKGNVVIVEGVGLQLDWGWDQVAEDFVTGDAN